MMNPISWFRKSRPTGPVPFGHKMAWIAIRSEHPEEIAAFLCLKPRRHISWKEGIEAAYDSKCKGVFVSPAVEGWTFVIGWSAAAIYDAQPNKSFRNSLDVISARFGEAQGFATHRVSEYHLWMLAKYGQVIRSFEYVGDQGEVLDNFGPLTQGEQALQFFNKPYAEWQPTEDDLMRIAGKWGIDPTKLTEDSGRSEWGVFGEIRLNIG